MLLRTFLWVYGVGLLISLLIERVPPLAIAP